MFEVVHINSVSSLCVSAGKLVDVAGKLVVADDFVQRFAVLVGVVRMEPVRVLINNGVSGNLVDVGVELGDRPDKLVSRDLHVLLAVDAEELRQIVDDKVKALLGVRTHQDVGFLERLRGQRLLRSLV